MLISCSGIQGPEELSLYFTKSQVHLLLFQDWGDYNSQVMNDIVKLWTLQAQAFQVEQETLFNQHEFASHLKRFSGLKIQFNLNSHAG